MGIAGALLWCEPSKRKIPSDMPRIWHSQAGRRGRRAPAPSLAWRLQGVPPRPQRGALRLPPSLSLHSWRVAVAVGPRVIASIWKLIVDVKRYMKWYFMVAVVWEEYLGETAAGNEKVENKMLMMWCKKMTEKKFRTRLVAGQRRTGRAGTSATSSLVPPILRDNWKQYWNSSVYTPDTKQTNLFKRLSILWCSIITTKHILVTA